MNDQADVTTPALTRVRMNTTVTSPRASWKRGREYDVDAEQAAAWVRDRVAVEVGAEKAAAEAERAAEERELPRASEVNPDALTGRTAEEMAGTPTFDAATASKAELVAEAERRNVTVKRADGGDGAPLVEDYRAALAG